MRCKLGIQAGQPFDPSTSTGQVFESVGHLDSLCRNSGILNSLEAKCSPSADNEIPLIKLEGQWSQKGECVGQRESGNCFFSVSTADKVTIGPRDNSSGQLLPA